jgi:Ca2+-binding RTX toxin-like protein
VVVEVDLSLGIDSLGNTLTGIEKVIGSPYGTQQTGTSGNDILQGATGRDILIGQDGDDQLFGNGWSDTLSGGDGNDLLSFSAQYPYIYSTADGGNGFDYFEFFGDAVLNGGTITTQSGIATNIEALRHIGHGGASLYVENLGWTYDLIYTSNFSAKMCYTSIQQSLIFTFNQTQWIVQETDTDPLVDTYNNIHQDALRPEPRIVGSNYGDTFYINNVGYGASFTLGLGNDAVYYYDNDNYFLTYTGGFDTVHQAENLYSLKIEGDIEQIDIDCDQTIISATPHSSGTKTTILYDLIVNVSGKGSITLKNIGAEVLHGADDIFGTADDVYDYTFDKPRIYLNNQEILLNGIFNMTNAVSSYRNFGLEAGDILLGTSSNEGLYGYGGDDLIEGYGGNDTLQGLQGDDILIGGDGADTLEGGLGDDNLEGGADPDWLYGNQGEDELDGGADNDKLYGENDNDILRGEDGEDQLYGGYGDDILEGGSGSDYIDGEEGIDTVSYAGFGAAVTINLALINNQNIGSEVETIKNVENATGSAYADILKGNFSANILQGGGGDDTLVGGADNDTLDGGSGTDTADYSSDAAGVIVDLSDGTASDGLGDTDTLISIENVKGSAYNDILTGNSAANVITGNAGDDIIEGGTDNDTLNGGSGSNLLTDESGDETYVYSGGVDTIIDSGGTDVIQIGAGVTLADLTFRKQGNYAVIGVAGSGEIRIDQYFTDPANRIETVLFADNSTLDLSTVSFPTIISGSNANNVLNGTSGYDIIYGQGGFDVLRGYAGDDVLYGGNDGDELRGGEGADALYGENGGDELYGESGADILDGGASSDWLFGGDDDDQLFGGDGNDLLSGGAGNDTLDGGAGTDTAYYAQNDAAVKVNLAVGTVDEGRDGTNNETVTGIENVIGTLYGDWLLGDAGANELTGNAGNDRLEGGAGNDILHGGDGDDTNVGGPTGGLFGGTGDDTIYGGDGNDVLAGQEDNDTLYGDAGNDRLEGGSGNDILYGGDGDDTNVGGATGSLQGGTGDDILYGGAGDDVLAGNEDNDTLYGEEGSDRLYGNTGVDQLFGGDEDDFLYGMDANDELHGGEGSDRLYGDIVNSGDTWTGDDALYGDAGVDYLYGHSGNDVLSGGPARAIRGAASRLHIRARGWGARLGDLSGCRADRAQFWRACAARLHRLGADAPVLRRPGLRYGAPRLTNARLRNAYL